MNRLKNRVSQIVLATIGMMGMVVSHPTPSIAQIGVGTTTPHPSAMLHIAAGAGNNKGLVVPSITSASRVVLDSTQNLKHGLIFFDTDLQKFYYFHNSPRQWFELDHDWIRKDVAGASPVVGTHIYSGVPGNVGIGTAANVNPGSKLTVVGNMAVGSASYTQDSVPPANGATFGTWVGIATRTRTAGHVLDVNGNAHVHNSLIVDATVDANRVFGEGTVPPGTVCMWSGTLNTSTNFDANGLGVPGSAYQGWHLCNGKDNTPDLRGRFIVGLSNNDNAIHGYPNPQRNSPDYLSIGGYGGEDSVQLTVDQMPTHSHTGHTQTDGAHTHRLRTYELDGAGSPSGDNDMQDRIIYDASGPSETSTVNTLTTGSSHSHVIPSDGLSHYHENRPPYYVLAYIVKLP